MKRLSSCRALMPVRLRALYFSKHAARILYNFTQKIHFLSLIGKISPVLLRQSRVPGIYSAWQNPNSKNFAKLPAYSIAKYTLLLYLIGAAAQVGIARIASPDAEPNSISRPANLFKRATHLDFADIPNIEAGLNVVGVYFPSSNTCGNFNVIMHLGIKNNGQLPLDSLQAFLDLRTAYGTAFLASSRPKVSVVDSANLAGGPAFGKYRKSMAGARTALVPNPAYNGETDFRLLLPVNEQATFYLPVDSVVYVRVEFEIRPVNTTPAPWISLGVATGRALQSVQNNGTGKIPLTDQVAGPNFGSVVVVRDTSTQAVQNDNCWSQTRLNGGVRNVNITLDSNCQKVVTAGNLLPNFIPSCGFAEYPEGSYYAVIIQDKHLQRTVWTSDDPRPFDAKAYLGRHLTYEVMSVANHCQPVWGDLNFEDKTPPRVICPADTDKKPGGAFTFICTDVDSVLNVTRSWSDTSYAYFAGRATGIENCSEAILEKVSDFLISSSTCSEQVFATAVIERTFHFRDLAGNTSTCKQLIYFRRPRIVLPDCKLEVPNHLARGDSQLLPTDLLGKYGLSDAVPYYLNGAGRRTYLINKDHCGFAIRYVDKSDFSTGDCGRKVIRTWAIMDWCYGMVAPYPDFLRVSHPDSSCYSLPRVWSNKEYVWDQFIVVGDETPPVVRAIDADKDGFRGTGYAGGPSANPFTDNLAANYDAGDYLEASTGPVDCTGSMFFNRNHFTVEEENDWCYDIEVIRRAEILDQFKRPTGQYSLEPDFSVRVSGNCQTGYLIGGIPMPVNDLYSHFIKVTVTNTCYGRTSILIPVRVVDRVSPVMKCTDRLTVTFDNLGYGAITTKSVDVGSSDNCSKLAWTRIRRAVPNGECRANWANVKDYVDANGNGIVDAGDYIDENRNQRKDTLEVFVSSNINSNILMSPLLETLPMFCCEGDSVMVELWGEDKAGNRNFCWNWVRLEDKSVLDYSLPFNQTYTCKDNRPQVNLLSKSGTFAQGTPEYTAAVALFKEDLALLRGHFCAPVTKEIVVSPSMRCEAGTITVSWRLTKLSSKGPVVFTTPSRTLTILPVNEYNLMFPADISGNCTDLRDTANVVDGGELGCDILAVLVQDQRFNSGTGVEPAPECYKIFRTFTVINWCQYSESCLEPMNWAVVVPRDIANRPGSGAFNGINVLVRDPDALNPASQPRYYFEDEAGTIPYPGSLPGSNALANAGDKIAQASEEVSTFTFSGADPRGNPNCPIPNGLFAWMFTQHILINDNVAPEVLNDRAPAIGWIGFLNNETCSGEIFIEFTTKDLCAPTNIRPDTAGLALERVFLNPGRNKSARVAIPSSAISISPSIFAVADNSGPVRTWNYSGKSLPVGQHSITIVARDECGNLSRELDIPFEIIDNRVPAPICLNGLSMSLMPNPGGTGDQAAQVVAWASDFIAGPVYDCNGQGQGLAETDSKGRKLVKNYYVVKDNGDGVWDTRDSLTPSGFPLNKSTSVVFNCADSRRGPIQIRVYSEDNLGNMSWCETFAAISDPSNLCGSGIGMSVINGIITTENKINLEGVEVNLSGSRNMTYMTGSNGNFSFNSLERGYDYTITPSLNKDFLNGVTTMDIVMITRHILGFGTLNSPYKLIAADINNSKSVTTMDLVQLRRIILGIESRFQSNSSWRFIDAAYRFPNPANPWQFNLPEIVSVNNLVGNVTTNFVAIKIGDVNGSASSVVSPRSSGVFSLKVRDMPIKAGREYRIPFYADLSDTEGFQFTLGIDLNSVELVDIQYATMEEGHFGIFAKEGLITTSYNLPDFSAAAARPKGQEDELFTLVLRAKKEQPGLASVLEINSRITAAEAYSRAGNLKSVAISLQTPAALEESPVLYQNFPNPFSGETLIGFNLVKAGEATLTVSDIQGRIIRVVRGEYGMGYHQLRLNSEGLPPGVLQYTLTSGDFTATKRMVVGQ